MKNSNASGKFMRAPIVALKRLPQRICELAGQELADKMISANDLVAEQIALRSILHETRTPK